MVISRFTLGGPETAVYGSTDLTGTKINFLSEQKQPVFWKQKNEFLSGCNWRALSARSSRGVTLSKGNNSDYSV